MADVLRREHTIVMPFVGTSMLPMLRQGRDSVLIEEKRERLQPLDVALYIRSCDGAYVLHRVLSVRKDGYLIRGDNCYSDEIVSEACVIGVLKGFYRKEKFIPRDNPHYLRYVRRRIASYPVRLRLQKAKNCFKKLWKKIKRK